MVSIDASNGVKINGATVVKADIGASNGVIHVIDTVILPKNGLRAADCGPPQHPGTSALGTSALGTAGTSARGTSAPRHFSL